MNELFNIKDYVVVITGGTGVLGRTIARYLALEGAQVVILGRKESVGKEIVDGIAKEGGKAEFMKTDVMNQELVQKNCDAILAKYGRVDTLLNAAGGNMPGAVPRTSTIALTNATLAYGLRIAEGLEAAVRRDPLLKTGVNTYKGRLTCENVALSFGMDHTELDELI